MYETDHLLRIIQDRMSELDVSQQELGLRAFGKASNSVVQDIRRGSSPSIERLKRVADALDLELYFGPRRPSAPIAHGGLAESDKGDDLPIPWLEPRLGQGSSPVRFSRTWMLTNGLAIDKLRALIPDEVECPSFVGKKSLTLVEEPSRPTSDSAWWAFRERGRTMVARIQRLSQFIVVLPVGPDYNARAYDIADPDFRPLGRVVWLSFVAQA